MPFCYGYIEGVSDALQSMYNALQIKHGMFCVPLGADSKQLADITINYIRDHPEKRHYVASEEVALALQHAFPCPD